MKKYNECTILTLYDGEYLKIDCVPTEDYSFIHTAKDIHPIYFTDIKYFYKIKDWINLRYISFDHENWNNNNIMLNEIAKFQKLSTVLIIDYKYTDFTEITSGLYIHENKMLIFSPSIQDFNNIPENIEFLNIIDGNNCDYTNIPINIKYLHLTIKKKYNFKQSNLPINLETLTITIHEPYYKYIDIDYHYIKKNIKIPFNCELIFDIV